MKVLIVGRTKMGGTSRCIGGITEQGESVRLLPSIHGHWQAGDPMEVGQIWAADLTRSGPQVAPHVEDVVATNCRYVSAQPNLRAHLLERVSTWRGGVDRLFDGKLGFTANGNGYVCHRLGIPTCSTGFWVPDSDLILRADGKHYEYHDGAHHRGLAFTGEIGAVPLIPAGTLVRISLARWWRPADADPDFEERCYLQLSGWYE